MKNSRNSPILEFFLFINQLSEFPSLRTIKFSCGEKRKKHKEGEPPCAEKIIDNI